MTDKELKKLSRTQLLELLIAQGRELEQTKAQLADARSALEDRNIAISQSGSIAEAALRLNGVFAAAEEACRQYTDNIRDLSQRQEAVCAQREDESQTKAQKLLRDTEAQCAAMVKAAKEESQAYWDELASHLDAYCAHHAEITRLLAIAPQSIRNKLNEK